MKYLSIALATLVVGCVSQATAPPSNDHAPDTSATPDDRAPAKPATPHQSGADADTATADASAPDTAQPAPPPAQDAGNDASVTPPTPDAGVEPEPDAALPPPPPPPNEFDESCDGFIRVHVLVGTCVKVTGCEGYLLVKGDFTLGAGPAAQPVDSPLPEVCTKNDFASCARFKHPSTSHPQSFDVFVQPDNPATCTIKTYQLHTDGTCPVNTC